MPNHVHALFVMRPDWPLEMLVHSWKSWSSKQIKRHLHEHTGPIWQKDYRDRMIRDAEHFTRVVRYIRRNPFKSRLKPNEYILWESEIAEMID